MKIDRRIWLGMLLSGLFFSTAFAQNANEHRQVYLALIHASNRQYASALASHEISEPVLKWAAYGNDTYDFLWVYPIEHLGDIETLSSVEFVIRDEPSLSRMPPDLDTWASQNCEFRLYYAYGG